MLWKAPLWVLAGLMLCLATGWWSLALFYAGPGPVWARVGLVLAYVTASLVALFRIRPFRKGLAVWGLLFLILSVWWNTLEPRADRDWSPDVARMPSVDVQGDRLTFRDVRNFDYRSETDYTVGYETRTVDLSKLTGLDLFMSYWGSPWICHTIMSWQFEGDRPLAVSIETRKHRGQAYSAVQGFFKQYELIYVVADERDLVRLRTNHRGEQVYLYRLATPLPEVRDLLLDYVASINDLVERPAFYDALTHNCTTTIRRHVTHIDPDAPPFDWRMVVNGRGDEMLYERGRIDTSLPFAELRERSLVNAKAVAADQDPAFSTRIRAGLPVAVRAGR